MRSRNRLHWPEARTQTQADTGPGSYAAWLASLSDESLALLDAVNALRTGDRFPPWAEPLLAGIKAEAEAAPDRTNNRRPNTRPAIDRSKLQEATDFGDVLKMTWPGADWQTKAALRTIATALGIPVPKDEPHPMRRTKLPKPGALDAGRALHRQPDRPVVKVCLRPARARSEPIVSLEPAEPEDDEAEDQPWIEDNERNWHPQGDLSWR